MRANKPPALLSPTKIDSRFPAAKQKGLAVYQAHIARAGRCAPTLELEERRETLADVVIAPVDPR